jgi:hypothetical protein
MTLRPRALFGAGVDGKQQDNKNNQVSHGDHWGVNVVSFARSHVSGSFTSCGGTFPT